MKLSVLFAGLIAISLLSGGCGTIRLSMTHVQNGSASAYPTSGIVYGYPPGRSVVVGKVLWHVPAKRQAYAPYPY